MKIIIVGASGTIGKRVTEELSKRHEIIKAGRNSGDIRVNIESAESIGKMFEQAGEFDACVVAAGSVYFGDLQTMTEENVYTGIRSKLMGQVNIVLSGQKYINDNGSFTLTTGILSEDPVRQSAAGSLANGGLNSFVKAAALEMKRGIRVNVVSPGLIEDSAKKRGFFLPGHVPVAMHRVVAAYVKSVEGYVNGEIIKVY